MSIKLSKKYRLISVLLLLTSIFLLNSVKCQNNNNNVMPNDEEDDFADDYNASGFNENNDGLSKEDDQYGNGAHNGNNNKPINAGPVGVNTYKDSANNRAMAEAKLSGNQQQQQPETFNEDDDAADDSSDLNGDDNSMDAESDDDYSQNDFADNTSDADQSIVKPNEVDSSSSSSSNSNTNNANNNNNNLSNQPPNMFTFQSSRSKLLHIITKPGILAGIVGGAVIGILTAILLIMFIVYRMRKKDEGSYALEETKKPLNAYDYRHCPTKEFYA